MLPGQCRSWALSHSDEAGQLPCSTCIKVENTVETLRERSEVSFIFFFGKSNMQLQRSLSRNVHLRTGVREWGGYSSQVLLKGFSLLR